MTPDFKDYTDFVPVELKLKPKARELVVKAVYQMLIQAAKAAKPAKAQVDDIHLLQAMSYFKDYKINPLHGYIFYEFKKSSRLIIGAKISCYYLVVARSGISAGNKKIKYTTDKTGNVVSATSTVYSKSPDGKGRVATTATVYLREFDHSTPSWKRPLLRLGQLAYYYAVKQSPMNDGSLSGVYTDIEIEAMDTPKPAKPKAKPKDVKAISKQLTSGRAKAKAVKRRHVPIESKDRIGY